MEVAERHLIDFDRAGIVRLTALYPNRMLGDAEVA
jgi:hypothetical protein